MKHLVRILSLAVLVCAVVLNSSATDKTLKVLQKFTHEASIGINGDLVLADVNGDGHKDIVARFTKNNKQHVGIWLWRGSKFSDSVDCTIDLPLVGGVYVTAGDLNGDGMADLAFLSNFSNSNPPMVVFGRATWPKTITVPDLRCGPVQDSVFESQAQYSSMVIADFNGDGYGDLCYQIQGNDTSGAFANAYGSMIAMYFGGAHMDSVADWVYKGGHTYPITGTSAVITPRYFSPWHMDAGDFNGDGYPDLLIGGWNAYSSLNEFNFQGNKQSMYNCGSGLVFLGGPGFDTTHRPDVILMASDDWLKYTTPAQYLWLGYSIFNAGDLNGDGVADISLPGWYMDIDLIFAGDKTWKKASSDTNVLVVRKEMLSYTKGRFNFSGYSDQFGVDVLSIGDVNGDGIPDLAATRNLFGGYAPEEKGIRLWFTKPGKTGAMKPDYETGEYITVMPASVDFDNDGVQEFFALDQLNNLTVLKVQPVYIAGVTDVPFDQGGHVRLAFGSTVDNDVNKYPYYSIWRVVPADSIVPSMAAVVGKVTKDFNGRAAFGSSVLGTSYRWEWVKNVPASLLNNYSVDVPTLYDSTASTNGKHYFMVIAHTSDPNKFYVSDIDSGVSVDNLAPGKPAGIAGSIVGGSASITWKANTEPDMNQYLIYKSTTSTIGDADPVYARTTGTAYTDPASLGTGAAYYAVRAEDAHGNVGVKSDVIRISVTGVEITDSDIPTAFALRQNYPNPFNPTTTIEYSLKTAGEVTLRVMNVLGEVVATLESGYKPAGSYRATFDASRLASGVYLYQIRTGNFVDVKRMLLVK
jgi:hypothetical protein